MYPLETNRPKATLGSEIENHKELQMSCRTGHHVINYKSRVQTRLSIAKGHNGVAETGLERFLPAFYMTRFVLSSVP